MPAYIETVAQGQPPAGQPCAVCGLSLKSGERLARCGTDGVLHHAECRIWNNNRCGAPGCSGSGALIAGPPPVAPAGVSRLPAGAPPSQALPPPPAPAQPVQPSPPWNRKIAVADGLAALRILLLGAFSLKAFTLAPNPPPTPSPDLSLPSPTPTPIFVIFTDRHPCAGSLYRHRWRTFAERRYRHCVLGNRWLLA